MPAIKAKPIDADRAAAFGRGFLQTPATKVQGTGSVTTATNTLYYSEQCFKGDEGADDDDDSSSFSSSATVSDDSHFHPSGSAERSAAVGVKSASSSTAKSINDDEDSSEDEAVLRQARERTQAMLCPRHRRSARGTTTTTGSSQPVPSLSPLEVYKRGRLQQMEAQSRSTTVVGGPSSGAKAGDRNGPTTTTSALGTAANVTLSQATPEYKLKREAGAAAVQEALMLHTDNSEFSELMGLLKDEVTEERQRRAEWKEEDQGRRSGAKTTTNVGAATSTTTPSSSSPSPPPAVSSSKAKDFAQLQDAAMELLFLEWSRPPVTEAGDSVKVGTTAGEHDTTIETGDMPAEDSENGVFIAADHLSAAFTLAASAAAGQQAIMWAAGGAGESGGGYATRIRDAPFTVEELMMSEVTLRNARYHDPSKSSPADALSRPGDIAYRAAVQLRRFMQAVSCIEQLVRDDRFIRATASFLFNHHKVFLSHYHHQSLNGGEKAAAEAKATPPPPSSSLVEHCHEEYLVYNDYGTKMSHLLLSTLSRRVSGFDEAEFVEALYDTPVTFVEGDSSASGREGDEGGERRGPLNVMSFPAWRLILALSSFDGFFHWMMDYIQEEYHLQHHDDDTGAPAVAVGGTRGLRALIRSTYHHQRQWRPASEPDPIPMEASEGDGQEYLPPTSVTPSETRTQTVLGDILSGPHSAPTFKAAATSPVLPLPPDRNGLGMSYTSLTSTPQLNASLSVSSTEGPRRSRDGLPSKFFPAPPSMADGLQRPLNPYPKRPTVRAGRDLPPVTHTTTTTAKTGTMEERDGLGGAPLETSSSVGRLASPHSAPPPLPLQGGRVTREAPGRGRVKKGRAPSLGKVSTPQPTPRSASKTSRNGRSPSTTSKGSAATPRGRR